MMRPASAISLLALLCGAFTASPGAASPGEAPSVAAEATEATESTPPVADVTPPAPSVDAKPAIPEAYRSAAVLGYKEFERGNYAEARAKFLEAHEAYPNARSLRALGAVEYDLRHYSACVAYLEQALASEENPLSPRLRANTEELLERARHYTASYTVELIPETAALTLDGEPVALRADRTLFLDLGDHELSASLEGFHSARKHVSVASRQPRTLRLTLDPVAPPVAAPPPAIVVVPPVAPAVREETPLRKQWWVWATSGVVLVATVVGLAVGLHNRKNRMEELSTGTLGVTAHASRRPGLTF